MYQQEDEQTEGETVYVCGLNKQCAVVREIEAKTPIACSLGPCADVRTTVLSQLNGYIGRRN